jgi:uncharacterized damage-inducible protein DinB
MDIKKYFRQGAIGALVDEYEKSVDEMNLLLKNVSDEDFTAVADPDAEDPDSRSIQAVMNHVINSGYGYIKYIAEALGIKDKREKSESVEIDSAVIARIELRKMLEHNIRVFYEQNPGTIEKNWDTNFTVPWKWQYNVEQMLEHAIVHILRHRRQVEKMIEKMKK